MIITNDKIKNLRKEINYLQKEIEKEKKNILLFSTYNSEIIADVFLKLISTFEGTEFIISKVNYSIRGNSYYEIINPNRVYYDMSFRIIVNDKNGERESLIIPGKFLCKAFNHFSEGKIVRNNDLDDYTMLIATKEMEKDIDYIEDFMNALYNERTENFNIGSSKENLFEFLDNYLEKNQDKINIRREKRKQYFEECKKKEELETYRKSCMIERKPLMNAIKHLINSDDNIPYNLIVSNEYDYRGGSQWNIVDYYNIVKIIDKTNYTICSFTSLKGTGESFPDEVKWAEIDAKCGNKDEYINFFKLRKNFRRATELIPVLKQFLDEIESIYKTKTVVDSNDVNEVLIYIKNNKKQVYTKHIIDL